MHLHVHQRDAIPRGAVRALRYPGEQWRFVMAAVVSIGLLVLVAAAIVAAGQRGSGVAELIVVVLGAAVSLWFTVHLMRARLLGSAVRVTAATFPEIETMFEEICAQLHYRRRVDLYVTDKSDPPVNLITYLGTHIILIEGGLVSELLEAGKRPQLRFLLARHIGSLKAKEFRLSPIVVMLNAANATQFVKPFLLPYFRTVAYTGDQVGLVACESVPAALEATGRLLVGGQLAAQLPLGGVLPQAAMVKRRLLPRLAQFVSPTPHTINRYFNLLAFARRLDPKTWGVVCSQLRPEEVTQLEALWQRSPHRRRAQSRHPDSPAEWWPGADAPAPVPETPTMTPPALDFPPPTVTPTGSMPAPATAGAEPRPRRWAGRIASHRRRVSSR